MILTDIQERNLRQSGREVAQLAANTYVNHSNGILFALHGDKIVAVMSRRYRWQWTQNKCPEYSKRRLRTYLNSFCSLF